MLHGSTKGTSPHDALFKAAFGQPDIARSELELVLPAEVRAQLDLATLRVSQGSFVDEELRQAHTDLLYAVRSRTGRQALVYVLFEHQSSFDALMPLRLLRYIVRIWEQWLRDHPGSSTLPVVVPVVLHHGSGGWRAAPELAAMLDAGPELLEAARDYLPLFRFVLDDLGGVSLDSFSSAKLHALASLVRLAFWASRSMKRLREAMPLLREIVASLVRDEGTRALLAQLYLYLLRAAEPDVDAEQIRTILLDVAGPQGREDVMNAGEQLIEQGRAEGLAKGFRAAVMEVVGARRIALSDRGRARLSACHDVATLQRWLVRAATAGSEAEIFAEDAGQ